MGRGEEKNRETDANVFEETLLNYVTISCSKAFSEDQTRSLLKLAKKRNGDGNGNGNGNRQ
jgi:hypothetical protein